MSKQTQNFRLYELLKSTSAAVTKQAIAATLGVKVGSVPVYIHELKRLHKAEIVSVRDGREVVAYKLISTKDVKVPEHRKNAASVMPVKASKKNGGNTVIVQNADGSVPVPDEDLDIAQVGEREFADIRSALGVDTGFGRGSDY